MPIPTPRINTSSHIPHPTTAPSPHSPSISPQSASPHTPSPQSSGLVHSHGSLFPPQTPQGKDRGLQTPATKDGMRVIVRLRPPNQMESSRGDKIATSVEKDRKSVLVQTGDNTTRPLTFDVAMPPNATQTDVFEESGVTTLLDKAMQGYACTIFAFGQTGSGKTHTMSGELTEENMGIVPRGLRYIWDKVQPSPEEASEDTKYQIKASYLEVYNETVRDLLNPRSTSLAVRYTAQRGFYVENLLILRCDTLADLFALLQEGLSNRTAAAHAMNIQSSRSHSILTLQVDSEYIDPTDGHAIVKHGKMSFVDLAGSERVKETKSEGDTLVESGNINKSLLTLGNCISALSDPKKRAGHIPYRDSKLTRLLADSLGGSGLALMVTCISPSAHSVQETLKTLRYASRAKHIQNRPSIKIDPREDLINQLREQLRMSMAECEYLRGLTMTGSDGKLPPIDSRGDKEKQKVILEQCMQDNEVLRKENSDLNKHRSRLEYDLSKVLNENEELLMKLEKLMTVLIQQKQFQRSPKSVDTSKSNVSPSVPIAAKLSPSGTRKKVSLSVPDAPDESSKSKASAKERKLGIDRSWNDLNLSGLAQTLPTGPAVEKEETELEKEAAANRQLQKELDELDAQIAAAERS